MKKILMIFLLTLAVPALAEVSFDDVDTNQDGEITEEELDAAIASGIDTDDILVEIQWDVDDKDSNGSLSRNEFGDALQQIKD